MPIENSIEGMVNFTQDALAFDHELLIVREVVIDIEHCLLARPGVALADVVIEVHSIPVATAQCHRYLREHLPDAEVLASNSTADAARIVAEDHVGQRRARAAGRGGPMYGLDVIAEPTSPTTKATRPGSSSSPATGSRHRPATTARRW